MAQDSSVSSTLKAAIPTTRFPWGLWSLLLLPYLPFGIFMCLWRICLSLQAILLLLVFPEGVVKRFMLRVLFCVLGVAVTTEGHVCRTKLLVSNRLSALDHIALHLATACITVSTGGKTPPLAPLFPHWTFPCSNDDELRTAAKALPEFSEESVTNFTPYLVQPEPLPTTGTHSLLKFSEWPFCLDSCLQPVSLSLTRPFPVALATVHSSGWTDLLVMFFLPISIFHIKFLPILYKTSDESDGEFACSMQESLRSALRLHTSQLTLKDVNDWLADPSPSPSSARSGRGHVVPVSGSNHSPLRPSGMCTGGVWEEGRLEGAEALETLVQQVTAILPQVPHTVIRADLRRTGSIDVTITNLLEGHVQYTPTSPPPLSTTVTAHTTSPSSVLRRRGNAAQRQLSLEERKKELLQTARRRYMEKHGSL